MSTQPISNVNGSYVENGARRRWNSLMLVNIINNANLGMELMSHLVALT
jgi:hypothetical protein